MSKATFHNIDTDPFTGWWNGRSKTIAPGERIEMPAYLAEHFAKHLTNHLLIKAGKEVYTSPKNPGQVPQFMEIFKKCFIQVGEAPTPGSIDDLIGEASEPSMNIKVVKPVALDQGPAAALAEAQGRPAKREIDLYDASNPNNAPGGAPMVIGGDDGDEGDFATDGK